MNSTNTAPINQEKIAAGPACCEAYNAPNSQPDPMIEPTLVNSNPTRPMSRRSLRSPEPCLPAPAGAATPVMLLVRSAGQSWQCVRDDHHTSPHSTTRIVSPPDAKHRSPRDHCPGGDCQPDGAGPSGYCGG